MNKEELNHRIKNMAYSGSDFDEIMKELKLKGQGIKPEELKEIRGNIDLYITSYQLAEQERSKSINLIILGCVIFLIGATVTIYTYLGRDSQYILAYGAIIGGAWIAKEGYQNYNKSTDEILPRKDRFNKFRKMKRIG